jgi:glycosyltransferase involved in cell wall biosynthesis
VTTLRASVVVPTYNRAALLLRCLDALAHQSCPPSDFEVIVVDDGSTDGTADAVRGKTFPFRCEMVLQEHGGAARARNAGAARATADILAFTEDDVVPDGEWLSNALAALAAPGVDVVEGSTVYEDTGEEVRRFEGTRMPSFIPCNLVLRRDLFVRVGGYDAAFIDLRRGLYFREDSEFGFRLLEGGARVVVDPGVRVAHPRQFASVSACFRHARRYVFDALLYKKHPQLFRRYIEVKRIAGMTVRRVQHLAALLWAAGVAAGVVGALLPSVMLLACGVCGVAAAGTAFQWKYMGRRMLRVSMIPAWCAFVALPGVYLWAVLTGCFRFRSFGVLL